ncbi:MAG: alginate export family protein [Acidobacteria bacterium]|nr:alginate export family protein [Acidobacteriota bacterium]
MKYTSLLSIFFASIIVSAGDFVNAVKNGTWNLNLRYRLEYVDQDNIDNEALASTLRTRLGYKSGLFHGYEFYIDFENVTAIGNDLYNSTANGVSDRPIVADPEDTEVNQVYLAYKGFEQQTLTLGRQRITLDDHRFVGNVGWRQNEQTYDGLRWSFDQDKHKINVVYFENVNRIFGDHQAAGDWRTQAFLAHYNLGVGKLGTISFFGHFFEIESVPENSHSNLGFRMAGKVAFEGWSLLHALSYVTQADYKDGRDAIDADYVLISCGPAFGNFDITLNYEVLGSNDGIYGFSTPFATLHAHNGWADKFLNTPAAGLVDLFLKANLKAGKWNLLGMFHQFESDEGSADYGSEFDFQAARKINDHLNLGLKAAVYDADTFSVDTTKIWITLDSVW